MSKLPAAHARQVQPRAWPPPCHTRMTHAVRARRPTADLRLARQPDRRVRHDHDRRFRAAVPSAPGHSGITFHKRQEPTRFNSGSLTNKNDREAIPLSRLPLFDTRQDEDRDLKYGLNAKAYSVARSRTINFRRGHFTPAVPRFCSNINSRANMTRGHGYSKHQHFSEPFKH